MTITAPNDVKTGSRTDSWIEFAWYIGGHGSYFASFGVQSVIFPYLITFYLHMPADMVGIAQMFQMLPNVSLVLIGGASADRNELRMHLVRLLFLAVAPLLLLIGFIITGHLTFFWLVFCATAVGCVGAFVMPARDSLLSRVSSRSPNGNLQQAVMITTASQFGFQAIGMIVALVALYEFAGPEDASATLLLSVLLMLISAFCSTFVHPAPPEVVARDPDPYSHRPNGLFSMLAPIGEGLAEVWRSPNMRPVIPMMFMTGMLFLGVLLVLLQIMIRDVYHGTIHDFTYISLCFMGGIAVTSVVLSQIRSFRRQGRAFMLSLLCGLIPMIALHFGPAYWMLYPLAIFWGAATGVTLSVSRAIVQRAAPESHRARILSIYTMGFLGGAPFGSIMIGYAIKFLGPFNAVLVPTAMMIVLWLAVVSLTDIWNITQRKDDTASKAQ